MCWFGSDLAVYAKYSVCPCACMCKKSLVDNDCHLCEQFLCPILLLQMLSCICGTAWRSGVNFRRGDVKQRRTHLTLH